MTTAEREAFLKTLCITTDDIRDPDDVLKDRKISLKTRPLQPNGTYGSVSTPNSGGTGIYSTSLRPKGSTHPTTSLNIVSAAETGAASVASRNKEADAFVQRGDIPSTLHSLIAAQELKTSGNDSFERGEFSQSIHYYTEAINLHGRDPVAALVNPHLNAFASNSGDLGVLSNGSAETIALLASLYSNRSAAFMQVAHNPKVVKTPEEAYEHALFDAEQAVALRPKWFKAYSRQGDAHFKLKQYAQATDAYQMALCMEPKNANLAKSLKEAQERVKSSMREQLLTRRKALPQSEVANSLGTKKESVNSNVASYPGRDQLRTDIFTQYSPIGFNSGRDQCVAQKTFTRLQTESLGASETQPFSLRTGEDYRAHQLEQYRRQREERTKRLFGKEQCSSEEVALGNTLTTEGLSASHSRDLEEVGKRTLLQSTAQDALAHSGRSSMEAHTTDTTPVCSMGNSVEHIGSQDIPYDFSSAAATAYQQKLLENFRRKKGMQ